MNMAEVVAVCISTEKGTPKVEVPEIEVKIDHGIVGDAHAGNWHRQISLLGDESVDTMRQKLPDLPHGAFAENILTRGICLYKLPVGTKLRVGPALLEVTQIGKECHKGCAIRQITGDCVMPREGIFTKVLEEGTIRAGDAVEIVS
jgi:MOSC domain-containing protein YiiM